VSEDRALTTDLTIVAENVRRLAQHVGDTAVMAVVKQDAYRLGLVPCARAALAGGASWLGVAHVPEALALRQAGIAGVPILVLMAVPGEDHEAAVHHGIDLTAGSTELVGKIAAAARRAGQPARLQLKADTGLSRGGAPLAYWPDVVDAAVEAEHDGLVQITALWSHFACSDTPGHPSIWHQLDKFDEATALAEKKGLTVKLRHMANTAAALTVPESRFDLVRFGGALFGLSTLPGGPPAWLKPALTLKARLSMVKRVPPGTGVGYGLHYVTEKETTLGLVPLGYADGIRRSATGHRLVGLHGRRWPIVGTVSMDQVIVDFGDEPVAAGDEVTLFGPGDDGEPTAQQWADALGTISYEITVSAGARIPRIYAD
jgi:alanine racemase